MRYLGFRCRRERTTLATVVGRCKFFKMFTEDEAFILCQLSCCKYTNLHITLSKSSYLTIKYLCEIIGLIYKSVLMATAVQDKGCVSICPQHSSTLTYQTCIVYTSTGPSILITFSFVLCDRCSRRATGVLANNMDIMTRI